MSSPSFSSDSIVGSALPETGPSAVSCKETTESNMTTSEVMEETNDAPENTMLDSSIEKDTKPSSSVTDSCIIMNPECTIRGEYSRMDAKETCSAEYENASSSTLVPCDDLDTNNDATSCMSSGVPGSMVSQNSATCEIICNEAQSSCDTLDLNAFENSTTLVLNDSPTTTTTDPVVDENATSQPSSHVELMDSQLLAREDGKSFSGMAFSFSSNSSSEVERYRSMIEQHGGKYCEKMSKVVQYLLVFVEDETTPTKKMIHAAVPLVKASFIDEYLSKNSSLMATDIERYQIAIESEQPVSESSDEYDDEVISTPKKRRSNITTTDQMATQTETPTRRSTRIRSSSSISSTSTATSPYVTPKRQRRTSTNEEFRKAGSSIEKENISQVNGLIETHISPEGKLTHAMEAKDVSLATADHPVTINLSNLEDENL